MALTIGGVPCKERPGSPTWTIGSNDVTGVRVLTCAWQHQNQVVLALTTPPHSRTSGLDRQDYDFPYWNGTYQPSDGFYTKLTVKEVTVEPEWDGRQKEIDVDSARKDVAKYGTAKITVVYGLELEDRRSAELSSSLSTRLIKGQFKWASEPTVFVKDGVQSFENTSEITLRLRTSELKLGAGETVERNIASLKAARNSLLTINSRAMYFQVSKRNVEYPAKTLLFANYEVENTVRLGRLDSHIVYTFLVAPAYTATQTTGLDWEYEYDPGTPGWRAMDTQPYAVESGSNSRDWNNLVPWVLTEPGPEAIT